MKKINNIIRNNQYKMIVKENSIYINNFQRMIILEEKHIFFTTIQKKIHVYGHDLKMKRLVDNEILLSGNIKTIEVQDA